MEVGLIGIGFGGFVLLVVLAVLVGMIKSRSVDQAWNHIADERRRNAEERARLNGLLATVDHCRTCPYRPDAPLD
ncbi:hypothetical protein [Pseudonocardia humida]|uniref:Uncharacterized protein n=1 Tax=Pseudonocardia humida TaxID=2800819 RepID=A0ABT1A930_9PSEU|nr:hypothetical protein [Pseudonocardia humida]MCO1659450.1 hypothetical protein [Pseudonocardia humida]